MNDDVTLGMLQICDSMFPSGLFSTSNGIEFMYLDGQIKSATDLKRFCSACLQNQVGPVDCAAATQAYRYAAIHDTEKLERLDQKVISIKTVRESRKAYRRSGIQTARCVSGFVYNDTLDWYVRHASRAGHGSHPVAVGICCCAMNLPDKAAPLAVSYSFVTASMGAALRLGMIHHMEAQQVIRALQPDMTRAAEYGYDLKDMWQFCPQAEIMQMSHENMDTKMFIT